MAVLSFAVQHVALRGLSEMSMEWRNGIEPPRQSSNCLVFARPRMLVEKPGTERTRRGGRGLKKFFTTRRRWGAHRVASKAIHAVAGEEPGTHPGIGGDPELRNALQLASNEELHELVNILYGRSPLSPVLKSMTPGDGTRKHRKSPGQVAPLSEREALVQRLEARFFFLAADAKSTIIGQRPTYRQVLLRVREKLQVPCSSKLVTADLEAEIFLHLLQEYSSEPARKAQHEQGMVVANEPPRLRKGGWRQKLLAPVVLGSQEVFTMLAKGSSAIGISTLQRMALERLTTRVLQEAARYQVAAEAVRKGGAAVAAKIESHYAVLAARQGLTSAAARHAALRSTMTFLGPVIWGSFLADVMLRSVGTDYGRVVRTIFALAQIRLTRTYGWTEAEPE